MPFVKDGQLEKSRPSLQGLWISHDQCPQFGCFDNLVMHIFQGEGKAVCRRALGWFRRCTAKGVLRVDLDALGVALGDALTL